MRVSCNECDWVGEVESRDEIPSECPNCGENDFTVGNETPVPSEAREEDGCEGQIQPVNVFPQEYPEPLEFEQNARDMSGEECLNEVDALHVDFDRVRHRFIETPIVLPRPIWICGIKLSYNARCRPERDWEHPGQQPEVEPHEREGQGESSDSSVPPNPFAPIVTVRQPRRGRIINANAALALARFFRYIHQLGVVQVDHAGIWPGRADPNNPGRNSAHGWGNGIDLCWFYLVSGDNSDVAGFYGPPRDGIEEGNICRDWGPLLGPPRTPKERFLRQMYTELQRHFTLVVGPDETARGEGTGDHTTHFHVDVHPYQARPRAAGSGESESAEVAHADQSAREMGFGMEEEEEIQA
jgi:predicted  nucleic acid-binding Zn-ribbon protein